MATRAKIGHQGNITCKSFFVLVFLVFYAAASLRINSIHEFFHSENLVELHSAEQESNPCHISIYHQREAGCEHKSHITESTKCSACECKVSVDDVTQISSVTQTSFQFPLNEFPFSGEILSCSDLTFSERAPPTA
jgi:hypothetical protein